MPIGLKNIGNTKVDWWNHFHLASGALTGLGARQCFILGTQLQDRYMNPNSPYFFESLSRTYRSSQFSFISSPLDRCLQSSWAFGTGLFNGTKGPDFLNKRKTTENQPAFPASSIPFPIIPTDKKNDVYLRGHDKCPKLKKNQKDYRKTKEYKAKEKEFAPLLSRFAEITGNVTNLSKIKGFVDIVLTLDRHKILDIPELAQILPELKKAGDYSVRK